ncbi:MAG: M6 family metalloprotease domain-containing protein [Caldisericia bacterium]
MLRKNLNKIFRKIFSKILIILILLLFNPLNLKILTTKNYINAENNQIKRIGVLKPVVLLVEFPDLKSNYEISTPEFYNSILFEKNNKSFYDYFYENSQGKLEIKGKIYSNLKSRSKWFNTPENYNFYENGNYGMGKYPNNSQKLVEDIVNIVDEFVDFSEHDGDQDGYVDGIIIIYAGSSVSTNENKRIYPHKWMINPIKKDDKFINKYIMISEYKNKPGDFVIGPLCHEFGHILGGIDLYDLDSYKNYSYDNQISNGLGKWSVMSYGIWGKKKIRGDSPSHFDAWHKIYFGWIEPEIISENEKNVIVNPVEMLNGNVYKIILNEEPYEYLLIENRQKINFDSDLPGEGILIYHVDESMINNSFAYSPFYETPNIKHYKVSLIQKDGCYELERGKNLGDENDTFKEGDEFILKNNNESISFYNKKINVIIRVLNKINSSYLINIQIIN